ncbi:MAG: hypothetical protein AABX69_00275, partial [Nanoarchaeota archaeon]
MDVVGHTKPNSRVHLFIDRTPFSFYNQTFEISGLANELESLPESKLDAKCRSAIAATSFCRTGADFSVDSDGNGNFKFDKVDLTAIFGGATRFREVPITQFTETNLNEEARESKTATIIVIATDKTGQRGFATQTVRIGTCWSGNQSWDVIPLTQYQSPTLGLSTERMTEGTETLYFYFNYSYVGRGSNAIIKEISLSRACSTREIIDPRFNISCQVMPSGNSPSRLNKEGTLSYSAVQLSRFPGMERFLEDDWKSFFKALNKEMTFPFKVRINYKHEVIDDNGVQKDVAETQTLCEQVSYVIDDALLDPRKLLPDWLLFDAVDILQDSIEAINKLQEQVNKLVEYVAIGCLAAFGLNLGTQSARRIVSFWEERAYAGITTFEKFTELIGLGKIKLKPEKNEYEDSCKETIQKVLTRHKNFKLKYLSDADLKKCFPATSVWWDREAAVHNWMRWTCDRFLGRASPSKWTEEKSDENLLRKIESSEGCAIDQGFEGQKLKAERCAEVARKNPAYSGAVDAYGADAKCVTIRTKEGGELYAVSDDIISDSERLYKLQHIPVVRGLSLKEKYAVK